MLPLQKTKICSSDHSHLRSFGCSLTQKANMHSQDHLRQQKQRNYGIRVLPHLESRRHSSGDSQKLGKLKLLAHSMIFQVGAFLYDSSSERTKALRVTTNSSLDRLFQVGALVSRLRASTKNSYAWDTIHCAQMPRKLSV